jgi:hypothetical protein
VIEAAVTFREIPGVHGNRPSQALHVSSKIDDRQDRNVLTCRWPLKFELSIICFEQLFHSCSRPAPHSRV